MGVVYQATDVRLGRQVALKTITPDLSQNPEFRSRFEREWSLAASLEHPNIIPVYHSGDEDGVLFTTMLWVEGIDLGDLIAREERLDLPVAADIVNQVGSGLDAAHARGLVHRDVKPGNILLRSERGNGYRAFLTDFGLSKRVRGDATMTAIGSFVGTVDYVAPEQILGDAVDARADIYSLGCVLFHTIIGSPPYSSKSEWTTLKEHESGDIPSVRAMRPALPPQIDEVVTKALAKSPRDRYESAGDLGRAALAAARREDLETPERSVARGDAAPDSQPSTPNVLAETAAPDPQETMAAEAEETKWAAADETQFAEADETRFAEADETRLAEADETVYAEPWTERLAELDLSTPRARSIMVAVGISVAVLAVGVVLAITSSSSSSSGQPPSNPSGPTAQAGGRSHPSASPTASPETLGELTGSPPAECPATCEAITETTGFQVAIDGKPHPLRVRADGVIERWEIKLGTPAPFQVRFFERNYGGPPEVRLADLRPKVAGSQDLRLVSQTPKVNLADDLGKTTSFPAHLVVKKEDVLALSVLTWAPALTAQEDSNGDIWRSNRKPSDCFAEHPGGSAHQAVGTVQTYTCVYNPARLLYAARLTPTA